MIKLILKLLDKIPYRTKFGMSLSDLLKIWYYAHEDKENCLCGGKIRVYQFLTSYGSGGWNAQCDTCDFLYDED